MLSITLSFLLLIFTLENSLISLISDGLLLDDMIMDGLLLDERIMDGLRVVLKVDAEPFLLKKFGDVEYPLLIFIMTWFLERVFILEHRDWVYVCYLALKSFCSTFESVFMLNICGTILGILNICFYN